MKLLFESQDYMQTALIEELLNSEEIPFVKTGDLLNGLIGGLPSEDTFIQIYVPESEFENASRMLG